MAISVATNMGFRTNNKRESLKLMRLCLPLFTSIRKTVSGKKKEAWIIRIIKGGTTDERIIDATGTPT